MEIYPHLANQLSFFLATNFFPDRGATISHFFPMLMRQHQISILLQSPEFEIGSKVGREGRR